MRQVAGTHDASTHVDETHDETTRVQTIEEQRDVDETRHVSYHEHQFVHVAHLSDPARMSMRHGQAGNQRFLGSV